MEVISSSETSVYFQQTTLRFIPEDGALRNYRCENLIQFSLFRVLTETGPVSENENERERKKEREPRRWIMSEELRLLNNRVAQNLPFAFIVMLCVVMERLFRYMYMNV
jgi:hypothetical protein